MNGNSNSMIAVQSPVDRSHSKCLTEWKEEAAPKKKSSRSNIVEKAWKVRQVGNWPGMARTP